MPSPDREAVAANARRWPVEGRRRDIRGYQPANLYEAASTLLILGVLLYMRRRGVPSGWLGISYFILYPITQLIVFNWRTDYETPVIL